MPLASFQVMLRRAGAQHRDGVGPLMGSRLVLMVSVLAAHVLCGAGRVAAQEGTLADSNAPRQRPYDEQIEPARRALDRKVRVTLEFVRRSCAPTPEQDAALERAGKELAVGRLDEARHGFTVTDLTLDPVVGLGLQRIVRAALDPDRAALFDDRGRALVERRCHAQLLAWVQAVDRKLLLSTQQRDDLLRLLAAQWRQPAPDARKAAIERALSETYEIDQTDLRLDEFVDFVERRHPLKIEIDHAALNDANVPLDAKIARQVNGVTLRAALHATFDELDLTYVIGPEALLLTTKTAAERSDELLNWWPFFAGDTLLFQNTTAGRTTVSRALPEVREASFVAILRPAQRAVWADSQQGRIRRAVTAPPANEHNDGHDGGRAVGRGDEEDDDAKANGVRGLREVEGLVERRRAAEEKAQRISALQAAAQADGLPTYAGTVDVGLYLKLAIDELDAAAGLSDAQRRKLELAGKIDIERRNDRLEELAQKLIDQQRQAVIAVKDDLVADVRKLLRTPSAAITDDSSRFQKLQSSVLTQEQVLRVAKARGARREFAHEAARQRVVALIAERVPLDDTQWNDASKRLRASWEPFVGEAFDARGIAATIPGELIEPIFDEAQWEMIKPVFGAAGKLEP